MEYLVQKAVGGEGNYNSDRHKNSQKRIANMKNQSKEFLLQAYKQTEQQNKESRIIDLHSGQWEII